MNIFKTSFLSAIETAIKLASGFVVIKFIAVQTGPEGVAFFGQFQNFIAAIIILVSGSFTTGLVRYSAQEKSGNLPFNNYLGNALGLGLLASLVIGILIFIFAQQLSILTLKSPNYIGVFYLLSFCAILIMFYQVLIAVFNGWGELYKLILCKSMSSLLLLLSSIVLVNLYGLAGGLVALIAMQSLSAFIGLWLMTRIKDFEWQWLKPKLNFVICKEFIPYWLMSIVTLISTPLILMLIRAYVASNIGWENAGLWEASWKISELYLLVITTALTTYYVPKLSQAVNEKAEQFIVREVLLLAVIAASFLALGIYLFRYWIVSLLFSHNFSEVSDIIAFQLIGSVIKIAAWVFAYHMLVKRKTSLFLSSELLFGTSFYLISRYFLDQFGLVGLSYAYTLNYGLYLVFCGFYYYRSNRFVLKDSVKMMAR